MHDFRWSSAAGVGVMAGAVGIRACVDRPGNSGSPYDTRGKRGGHLSMEERWIDHQGMSLVI